MVHRDDLRSQKLDVMNVKINVVLAWATAWATACLAIPLCERGEWKETLDRSDYEQMTLAVKQNLQRSGASQLSLKRMATGCSLQQGKPYAWVAKEAGRACVKTSTNTSSTEVCRLFKSTTSRKILIIGDSLGRQFQAALALYLGYRGNVSHIHSIATLHVCNDLVSVSYLRDDLLLQNSSGLCIDGYRIPGTFCTRWDVVNFALFDIVIINSGLHARPLGLATFAERIERAASFVQQRSPTALKVFFDSPAGITDCWRKFSSPIISVDEAEQQIAQAPLWYDTDKLRPYNDVAAPIFAQFGFVRLPTYEAWILRPDTHPHNDCIHFCFPPAEPLILAIKMLMTSLQKRSLVEPGPWSNTPPRSQLGEHSLS